MDTRNQTQSGISEVMDPYASKLLGFSMEDRRNNECRQLQKADLNRMECVAPIDYKSQSV